jgi:hypothetical protein
MSQDNIKLEKLLEWVAREMTSHSKTRNAHRGKLCGNGSRCGNMKRRRFEGLRETVKASEEDAA